MAKPSTTSWIFISTTVVKGHGVASGLAADSPYPAGTIAMQMPVFQALGLDLSDMRAATLNLSLGSHSFSLISPAITFRQVTWTDRHPPEDFSFTPCGLGIAGELYPGWVYYPHPETKARHFQSNTVIEVLAPPIAGLGYGSVVELGYDPATLAIH
ncbi:MAG: hypothetical protein HC922_10300 [Leptolyngbyaceae cyanobacterium SM2_3_12]|nr:hypothetical protein [Leptolyngbyaceae cyanobacterium SM2_3_12]